MDPSQLFAQLPVSQLGFGGLAGAAVGFTAKKIAKVAAIVLGLAFLLIQVLAYQGLISVNWGSIERDAQLAWQQAGGATLGERAWAVVAGNLPFGSAFAVGFALGFKLG